MKLNLLLYLEMKAFKLPRALFLNKEDELKKKKLEEKKFDSISKSGLSKKINEDLSQFIKNELIKKNTYKFLQ